MSAKRAPERTGAELLKLANSKATAFFAKHEEANELYELAAKKFQQEGDHKKCGDAYLKCAQITETKLKDKNDAATYYQRAAGAYVTAGDVDEALKVYRAAVKIHMDDDSFNSAAKMWKEISKLEEKAGRLDKALAAMDKAASCHEAENSKSQAASTNLQVARIATQMHDYKKAIEIFEKVAAAAAESGTGTWGAGQDSLYKAGLCQFVLDAKQNCSATRAASELKRYVEMHPPWANAREYKFLHATMQAFNERKLEEFTNIIWKEDRIRKLDQWTAKMLLTVKRILRDGPEMSLDVGGGADDSDIQDLLSGGSSGARGSASPVGGAHTSPRAETKSPPAASPAAHAPAAAARPSATSPAASAAHPPAAAAATAAAASTTSPKSAPAPAKAAAADDEDDDEEEDDDEPAPAPSDSKRASAPSAVGVAAGTGTARVSSPTGAGAAAAAHPAPAAARPAPASDDGSDDEDALS